MHRLMRYSLVILYCEKLDPASNASTDEVLSCLITKEPSGFLVNHWKPRELGVASTNHHS
jgi:hypothetical protein